MYLAARKTTPRVKLGRVCRKHSLAETAPHRAEGSLPDIVRERPGDGYRHLLTQRDVEAFLSIVPGWSTLSQGLTTVLLARGEPGCDGWHLPGTVAICAWRRDLWSLWSRDHFDEHRDIIERCLVPFEPAGDSHVWVRFDERGARAYQLMHVLLHELGHHHDRMTSRKKTSAERGEPYAESFANERAELLWRAFEALEL